MLRTSFLRGPFFPRVFLRHIYTILLISLLTLPDNYSSLFCFLCCPSENGESMQILHYENGQKYEPHFDYFHDQANLQLGGHRIATVLMYLSNVVKGGETVFPMWKVMTYMTSCSIFCNPIDLHFISCGPHFNLITHS